VRRQSEATTALCPTNFSLSFQVEQLKAVDKLKEALNKLVKSFS